eukprot:13677534-Heterocapsa_arctica.AAC.1
MVDQRPASGNVVKEYIDCDPLSTWPQWELEPRGWFRAQMHIDDIAMLFIKEGYELFGKRLRNRGF